MSVLRKLVINIWCALLKSFIMMIKCVLFVWLLFATSDAHFNVNQKGWSTLKSDPTKNWVVLIAGSSGFENYRHQADICHAYHIVRDAGVPSEQIITFMYDDIANHAHNPVKGKIFNNYEHKDYYEGVVIDYRGEEIKPETFLRVLKNDKELKAQGKKVLESTSEDNVFIYFSDHGGPGILGFPNDVLTGDELLDTLMHMAIHEQYNQMVLYIEACFSGSLFKDQLPINVNMYATTAANEQESSFACYCRDDLVHSCLGDYYSVNWMEDSEKADLSKRTLNEQYMQVRKETNSSHVMVYGDKTMGDEVLQLFQSSKTKDKLKMKSEVVKESKPMDVVDTRDVHIHIIRQQLKKATQEEQKKTLQANLDAALQLRSDVEKSFENIIAEVAGERKRKDKRLLEHQPQLADWSCLKAVYKGYHEHCFALHKAPDVIFHLYKLNNLCFYGYGKYAILSGIRKVCSK